MRPERISHKIPHRIHSTKRKRGKQFQRAARYAKRFKAPARARKNQIRFASRSSTKLFTASKAEAPFEKRGAAKCDSRSWSSASRSASVADSKATPCSAFGANVGVAVKSVQLSPRSPGKIFQLS